MTAAMERHFLASLLCRYGLHYEKAIAVLVSAA